MLVNINMINDWQATTVSSRRLVEANLFFLKKVKTVNSGI
jgi:hypothetical protein